MKNTTQEENRDDSQINICPKCVGTTTIFDGNECVTCNFCKGKGEVDEDKYNYFVRTLGAEFLDS